MNSELFQQYRALGHVCDGVPFHLKRLGNASFVTVAIGKAWQVYNCEKLRLSMIGPQTDRKIRALASVKEATFSAHGREIYVWNRAELLYKLKGHTAHITLLLVVGEYLLSVGSDQLLCIWDLASSSAEGLAHDEIQFSSAQITALAHPQTYLNKICVGFADGSLELWNIKTKRRIHQFNLGLEVKERPGITAVVQSPAVDVVAVGMTDGGIVLHNLRLDQVVFKFKQAGGVGVTALAFRTDGFSVLVSGSSRGQIAIWDLNKQALLTTIVEAHQGGVTALQFLAAEPVLVSSGADNSLKMWIFDQPDGSGRLLKSREGHSLPPTKIRFYGDGSHILSSGADHALRSFSILRDNQSAELSQGSLVKKSKAFATKIDFLRLAEILDFSSCSNQERRWSNILSCHRDDPVAHTWSFENKVLTTHKLHNEAYSASPVTALAISACGNFGIIGLADGRVERYNLQSGFLRAEYGGKFGSSDWTGHSQGVTGLAVDGINSCVVSGSLDCSLKFWSFKQTALRHTIQLESAVCQMLFQRESDLLAVVTDDLLVSVYDIHALKLVRLFKGLTHRATDMAFSPDGRWLVVSSLDSCVRVFDLPSGRLIDWLLFDAAVSSLSFSPKGDFLATTHSNHLGIFLWVNRSYFTNVFLGAVPTHAVAMNLPLPDVLEEDTAGQKRKLLDTAREPAIKEEDPFAIVSFTPIPKAELLTFSALPKSRWLNLGKLELIKERNKPKNLPKSAPDAPFFLPTLPGLNPQLDPSSLVKQEGSHLVRTQSQTSASKLATLLASNPDAVGEFLRGLGPTEIDLEIRSLGLEFGTEERNLGMFIEWISAALTSKRNFELLQSVLNLFLKVHGEALRHGSLLPKVSALLATQQSSWRRLEKKLQFTHCLVSHFGKAQM